MEDFIFKNLSYRIIGAALEVHRQLGPGFLEMVYEKALAHELSLRKIAFERQVDVPVRYKNVDVGVYQADMIVGRKVILELKAANCFAPGHEAQAHHYLIATGLRLALLLNFGTQSLEIKGLFCEICGICG